MFECGELGFKVENPGFREDGRGHQNFRVGPKRSRLVLTFLNVHFSGKTEKSTHSWCIKRLASKTDTVAEPT